MGPVIFLNVSALACLSGSRLFYLIWMSADQPIKTIAFFVDREPFN